MKKLISFIRKDFTLTIGFVLIMISFGIFLLPEMFSLRNNTETYLGLFMLNYIISIIFFVILVIKKIFRFRKNALIDNLEYAFLHLILCLISAYSLNREIPVFEQSVNWLQGVLMIQSIALILLCIRKQYSPWVNTLLFGILGIGLMLFVYFTVTLIPIYLIGAVGFFFFGISLHVFVPLMFVLTILLYVFRSDNRNWHNLVGFSIGIIFSIVFAVIFMIGWNQASNLISQASDQSLTNEKNDLPNWVYIAQHLPKNDISEKILKTKLVYSVAPETFEWGWGRFFNTSFDEVKKHDPLIMIATFFAGTPNISINEKINILQAIYDSRHQAQERLWTGEDLQTARVITNARIYPGLRIAYTEKYLNVQNNLSERAWPREQEAIYTFHLPEGSVITSLSLWINDKEEKGILTSKHKADTAYRSIVGVERHDPSLVRWQEGNTVSVRIFPCTQKENRRFKIGFTTPLRMYNQRLIYDNIWFDGPSTAKTKETVKIQMMDVPKNIELPHGFSPSNSTVYEYNGKYRPDWNISFAISPISANTFSFDGKTYQVKDYLKTYQHFNTQNVYLDINQSWSKTEFLQVWNAVQSKNVYVFNNQIIKLNKENAILQFDDLQSLNFSLFPIHEIKDPANSLVISKGINSSPNVNDLKGSVFTDSLLSSLSTCSPIKLFNIGYELSPFLKTLKELRVFEYDFGSTSDLVKLIKEEKFICDPEDSGSVVVNNAGIIIMETAGSSASNAPDHLLRLFAYNDVMRKIGKKYFNPDYMNEELVNEAQKAYVVSPVSGLIVLENQNDYDRFGIFNQNNSLKNASMKSSGAVPEPHEWLLISILVILVVYLKFKKEIKAVIKV